MQIDLKFIKSWGAYNAGEIARFVGDQAKVLIERGVALEHQAVAAVEKLASNLLAESDAAQATQTTQAKQATSDGVKSDGSTVDGPNVDGSIGDQAKLNQKTKPNTAATATASTTNTTI